jgi:hypothetical protein
MWDRTLSQLIGGPDRAEVPYDALMPRRVSNLLLVGSLYDYYTIIEDGRLSEMILSEYLDLDLRFTPSLERVSTAEEALEMLRTEPFDLVISMARIGEMNIAEFGASVQQISPGTPVVLLASSGRELSMLPPISTLEGMDSSFVWLGDVRIFLAIIKYIEDRQNVMHDVQLAGVKIILLIEDSVQFYSSYLPMLYTEILNQTNALTELSINRAQKVMRMRARPKVLLAKTYEEAMLLYDQYRDHLLGAIVDAAFPKEGRLQPDAGFQAARVFRERTPDLPLVVQSDVRNAAQAAAQGLGFIDKNSPTLLGDLRDFMRHKLGFGDFSFLRPDGTVISRSPDLRTMEWAIQAVPDAYLLYNVSRHDFYRWLMARTEFDLAEAMRSIVRKMSGYPEELRRELQTALKMFRQRSKSGVVAEYSHRTFEGGSGFVRIGRGSLGGKGRGLAFINSLINTYGLESRFPGVRIFVPPTAVLTTDIFDRFVQGSDLWAYALTETDDDKISRAFLEAKLPPEVVEDLWSFLQWVRYPLAVRSSSLQEDASYQPFAGIYKTYMIPNNHGDPEVRLEELCNAIKLVYASTYHSDAKAYMESLPNRLEEEKMAVIVQQAVGRRHGSYLYPSLAGVGRSVNFYPMPGMLPEDGIVSIALGMGKTVVDGGRCVRFCPACPRAPMQSFTPEDYLENSQRSFQALNLATPAGAGDQADALRLDLATLGLDVAEAHGTLAPVGSVYSADNDAVYDGISRPGIRIITMADILKGRLLPLPEITTFVLKVGTAASSCPVEVEFAVNLSDDPGKPHEFAWLQMRPLVMGAELQDIQIGKIDARDALCISHRALGNGLLRDMRDLIVVRKDRFERADTVKIAAEIGILNAELKRQQRPYLLIGPGRWGSADPWLGIPVRWAQISGARCIIETGFEDMRVDPSQGSHFFQNIMSFGIGYLTVEDYRHRGDYLDVSWLERQPAESETEHVRHISLDAPLQIAINGRINLGVVMKPV